MLDAILVGGYLCAYITAAAVGLVNCELYKDWKAEQEQERESAVVYKFDDEGDITTGADADLPEIVVVTD